MRKASRIVLPNIISIIFVGLLLFYDKIMQHFPWIATTDQQEKIQLEHPDSEISEINDLQLPIGDSTDSEDASQIETPYHHTQDSIINTDRLFARPSSSRTMHDQQDSPDEGENTIHTEQKHSDQWWRAFTGNHGTFSIQFKPLQIIMKALRNKFIRMSLIALILFINKKLDGKLSKILEPGQKQVFRSNFCEVELSTPAFIALLVFLYFLSPFWASVLIILQMILSFVLNTIALYNARYLTREAMQYQIVHNERNSHFIEPNKNP
ncbi:MAG: hypothetical protein EZS28_012357 [Streblomastix strix]|uniref:Uncharacterized protein n=1 Tax=Streblomastix strix TaxID=222440 RepID=A0A5J4WBS3_9EUKA|nr:MAG: hypothetical protein EZS28_012357 [Streblomastix strix]